LSYPVQAVLERQLDTHSTATSHSDITRFTTPLEMFIFTPPGVSVTIEFSQVGDKLCRKGNIHVTNRYTMNYWCICLNIGTFLYCAISYPYDCS